MQRPEEHQIDSRGKALLRQVFAELGWAVNEIAEDYGRDFEIEVFQNSFSTGIVVDVQLKSSALPAYSAAEGFVSQSLDRRNAAYLAKELRLPVLLIVADVEQRLLYWTTPQLDTSLSTSLSRSQTATCTIRVPTQNRLPESVGLLLTRVASAEMVLASRRLVEVPSGRYVASVGSHINSDVLAATLRDKSDYLELVKADSLSIGPDAERA